MLFFLPKQSDLVAGTRSSVTNWQDIGYNTPSANKSVELTRLRSGELRRGRPVFALASYAAVNWRVVRRFSYRVVQARHSSGSQLTSTLACDKGVLG